MKNLLYLYLLIVFCACDSQKTQQLETEYLESFSFILEEQQNLLWRESSNLHEKYLEMGKPMKAKNSNYFSSLLKNEIEKDSINLDAIYKIGQQIDIQENTHFFANKDSLTAFFELHKNPSPKQLLLSKLRLLRFGNNVIKKINQKHVSNFFADNDREFWEMNPDFQILTTLNKSSFHHGDTLKMTMQFIPIQKTNYLSNAKDIYLNDNLLTSDTFSIIATCEGTKPCKKECVIKTQSPTGSGNYLFDKQKYIVNPAK